MLGCHGPQEGVGSSADASGQGEGHYTPEEHCPTSDQVSGGQELGRGLQATQTLRDPWRAAARRYHCTVGMGLPTPTWCV